MSIDARVEAVICNEDGSGYLKLIDRPARRPGDTPGIAGQNRLYFDASPHDVTALNGLDIWGGADSLVVGRELVFARREGYTKIRFIVPNFHGQRLNP